VNRRPPSSKSLERPRRSSGAGGRTLSLLFGLCIPLSLSPSNYGQSTALPSGQPAEVYTKAMAAFASGDFPAALSGLREMLKLGADGAGMESVYFSIAAAEFNLGNMPQAASAFERYLQRYPAGAKVSDAQQALAQCYAASGEREKAATMFTEIVKKGGPGKLSAQLSLGIILREASKLEDASKVLQALVAEGLQSSESVQAALLLASVEAERGERQRALKILETLNGRLLALVDNPLQLNALAFDVGDTFLHAGEFRKALTAYAFVRRTEDLTQLQQKRVQGLIRKMEVNIAAAKADSSRVVELSNANLRLRAMVESAKQTMEAALSAKDNIPALRVRQASAYESLGRVEEAVLIFESLLTAADLDIRQEALLNLGSLHARSGDTAAAIETLQRYLAEFPKGRGVDSALFLLGSQHLQSGAIASAVAALTQLLTDFPTSPTTETGHFLLANAHFSSSDFAAAISHYQSYLKTSPKGEYSEESNYRISLARFFLGEYEPALQGFETYAKTFPDGIFAPDAAYRIAACHQAARKSEEVLRLCTAWEARFSDHPILGDVLALQGDAFNALDRKDEALIVYRRASLSPSSDEVVQYALFEANKLLQAKGKWDIAAGMFREFLAAKPAHPAGVQAIYWVARATAKSGKPEEAKAFLAEKIPGFIADRNRDAVEQLLSQLAQLCAKPPQGAQSNSTYDPYANLRTYLPKNENSGALVLARHWFAEAELARYLRKPTEATASLDQICENLAPKELGAALLAQCGDRLLAAGKHQRATEFYEELRASFPKSELLDYAYNGLGQMALQSGDGKAALQFFSDALDKIGASSKLKEVTLGRGKALLALGQVDEAKVVLEQVASTREWRGECTAEAVLALGKVQLERGDLPGAIQYFQRVFVAYQRYDRFVAEAYIQAAECFEKLGEPEKATAHYRELLSRPRLADLPEAARARNRLGLNTGTTGNTP
jgi:TolA-binding protein